MQTSLRASSYQYYDYGTLDCTSHLTNNGDDSQQFQHLHHLDHDQTQVHQINQDPNDHSATISDSSQNQIAQHQDLTNDTSYSQHQEEPVTCYTVGSQTVIDQNVQQVIIQYDQSQQYHLLESQSHINGAFEVPISSRDQENEDTNLNVQYQQDQNAIYQTVYYEPVSYANTGQAAAVTLQSTDNMQQPISFTSSNPAHLLRPLDPFSVNRDLTSTAYDFNQVQSYPTTLEPTETIYTTEPHQHHHVTQPTTINCQNSNNQPAADQQAQIYQMLELSGGNQYSEQQSQHHRVELQHHLLQTEADQQTHQQDRYVESQKQVEYQPPDNNCAYLDSESMGASMGHSSQYESHSSAASTSSEESSITGTGMTRDERRAREANIPLTYSEIVNLSIEQFNEQLAKHSLTESQLTLIKDIRRRGKNKVAAQSCRKRKMEQIYELQHEVSQLANKRRSLSFECSQLMKEHGNLVQEYDRIYAIIQNRMHHDSNSNDNGGCGGGASLD